MALTQLRSIEIGRGSTGQATGLKDSSMLTQDENIVDIKFTIQYRLKSAADYLFQNRNPDDAVAKLPNPLSVKWWVVAIWMRC